MTLRNTKTAAKLIHRQAMITKEYNEFITIKGGIETITGSKYKLNLGT